METVTTRPTRRHRRARSRGIIPGYRRGIRRLNWHTYCAEQAKICTHGPGERPCAAVLRGESCEAPRERAYAARIAELAQNCKACRDHNGIPCDGCLGGWGWKMRLYSEAILRALCLYNLLRLTLVPPGAVYAAATDKGFGLLLKSGGVEGTVWVAGDAPNDWVSQWIEAVKWWNSVATEEELRKVFAEHKHGLVAVALVAAEEWRERVANSPVGVA